jgi:hypothetical protein
LVSTQLTLSLMHFNMSFGNTLLQRATHADTINLHFLRVSLGHDMVRFIRMALEQLGHRVDINLSHVDAGAINLFWEYFYKPEQATELKRRGYRYGLICTEHLREDGLYSAPDMTPEQARQKFQDFSVSAQNAEFVWCLIEESVSVCRTINPNSHFLKFGHLDGFATLRQPSERPRQIDFHISGEPTERRMEMARKLMQLGFTTYATAFEPTFIRDSTLERTRATLSVQKTENHHIFSISRVHHAIMNRVPVIVEYDGPENYLSPYCIVSPKEKFLETCADFGRRPDTFDHAEMMYAKMMGEAPALPMLAAIVSETFAP